MSVRFVGLPWITKCYHSNGSPIDKEMKKKRMTTWDLRALPSLVEGLCSIGMVNRLSQLNLTLRELAKYYHELIPTRNGVINLVIESCRISELVDVNLS